MEFGDKERANRRGSSKALSTPTTPSAPKSRTIGCLPVPDSGARSAKTSQALRSSSRSTLPTTPCKRTPVGTYVTVGIQCVNALRFFVFNDKIKLELLAVPTFEGYKLPTDAANPWSVLPKETPRSLVWDAEGSRPELRLSNVEYGGRLSFALPGVDFSLAALHTWNKMPVIEYKPSGSQLTVSPRYYRMGFVGGDVSKPLGQFVLRGEAAFNLGKHFSYIQQAASTPQKGFNTINWLVGADWYAPHEWTVMAQFSSESIFKYESYVAQPRHNSLLTLCVSKKLLDSNLQLSDFTYFDLNHKGWFSRFTADYALNDHIHLLAGYDWFGGSEGMFGPYKHNSEVWAKAKYCF